MNNIKTGDYLVRKDTGQKYKVIKPYLNRIDVSNIADGKSFLIEMEWLAMYEHIPASNSTLDTQHGGDHYKKLGNYQPWQVLQVWLTPEEFRGYMKGTALERIARERNKGGDLDIKKAAHTLQAFIEMEENKNERL